MAEGKVYEIPERGLKWFKDKMDKLGKKAEKLVGEKMSYMVVGYHREENKNSSHYNETIYEVFVACPEPKLNGWHFAARIDHGNEVGNVVRTVGDIELPELYRHREPICDHCGYKRKRRDSFVVFNPETTEYKQVGTNCLKDFMGHPGAEKWAKLAEMVAGIGEIVRGSREIGSGVGLADLRWINTEDYCIAAAQSVLERGWVSRKQEFERGTKSTRSDAWRFIGPYMDLQNVTDEARELAEKALNNARGFAAKSEMNDYEHNAWVIANAEAIESRNTGIAASIVGVYYARNKPRRAAPAGVSSHQGLVGQKLERNVTLTGVFSGEFSTAHKFVDDVGNHYVWFASAENLGRYRDRKLRIKGTVRSHTEYRGVKQTQINRVKVIEVFDDAGIPQSSKLADVLV